MRKTSGISMALALMITLAACAPAGRPVPAPTQAPTMPANQPVETPATPAPDPAQAPAVERARTFLARQLNIDPVTIQVISVEKVEWPDSCLGLGGPAESCAAVLTPGYKITFDVAGQEYVVHTDEGGDQTRVAATPESAP